MCENRKIVYYPDATLQDLDAGVTVAYPLPPEHWSHYAYYVVPSFLMIGAQKCGTSALRTWLNHHPQLLGAQEECHFFDEVADLEGEWQRYLINRSFLVTKNQKNFSADRIHTFEKTPEYLDQDNQGVPIPELIRRMMPSGKFIVLLRNPTKRAYSAYQMGKKPRRMPGVNQEYIETDFDTLIKKRLATPWPDQYSNRLLTIGHYAAHLERWFRYFPREQILILFLEDFQHDPFAVMARIFTFLDLPSLNYQSLVEKNHRGLWVFKGEPETAPQRPYAPIPPEAKALLDAYYEPWNQRLRQLLPTLTVPWE